MLASLLRATRDDQGDVTPRVSWLDILKRAWRRSPGDYLICHALTNGLETGPRHAFGTEPKPYSGCRCECNIEELRYTTAAVAANPLSPHAHAALAEALMPLSVSTSHGVGWPPLQEGWCGIDPEWLDAEDLNDAIAEYREAIRLDPRLAYVRRNLGNVLMLKGEIENAVAEYREAVRLDPKDVWVHKEAAFRLYLRGRLDLAITELQQAIRLAPASDGDTADRLLLHDRMFLGTCYQEQGKLSQAFAMYREVLQLGGNWIVTTEGLSVKRCRRLGNRRTCSMRIVKLSASIPRDPCTASRDRRDLLGARQGAGGRCRVRC